MRMLNLVISPVLDILIKFNIYYIKLWIFSDEALFSQVNKFSQTKRNVGNLGLSNTTGQDLLWILFIPKRKKKEKIGDCHKFS